ncbi:MAG: ribosome silencing factor [Gammaproteobacteria bacterium]|nr:ribosome silencing factor [Gammaproteobacteria bacterium]MCW8922812.1 ribosome silencing factor [Gammaproteobacteria bacterium]
MSIDELRALAREALEDLKAEDIVELDVQGKTSVADYIIVASGNSARHVKSIANNVVMEAKHAGNQPLGVEGENDGEWVLVDLGDVVVHIMQAPTREFYNLEGLWKVTIEDKQAMEAAE